MQALSLSTIEEETGEGREGGSGKCNNVKGLLLLGYYIYIESFIKHSRPPIEGKNIHATSQKKP